jgi:gliding motility-associated-like protein
MISGTPTNTSPTTIYTITAYNVVGSSTTTLSITVTNIPPPNISYHTPNVYNINTAIVPLAPNNTGGAVPATVYGQVSTFAGSGVAGSADGTGTTATLRAPTRTVIDPSGNVYVADRDNNLIRVISPNGVVTTFAGNGASGFTNGIGTIASFHQPNGVAIDDLGNIYVADATNNAIRKITPGRIVTTLAGNGTQGATNGTSTAATFYYPYGLTVDVAGNIYVGDTNNNLIRKIDAAGTVTTFAGNGVGALVNGTGTAASFYHPGAIAFDVAGNIYVADGQNYVIRKITPAGVVTTYAGSGSIGSINSPMLSASFNSPSGICFDAAGYMYVADITNNLIRKIDPQGNVTTLAGSGAAGAINGIATAASFNRPNDVQAASGNLYVADVSNNMIRKIVLTGYNIDKSLPAGLTFDQTTGIISGTPTAGSPVTIYTVTAYNIGGSSTTTLSIEVTDLTFAAIPTKNTCGIDFDPGATSSLPITYTSSNTAVATIVAGKIHIVGVGTSTITATDGASTVMQILTVNAVPQPTVTISTTTANPFCQGTAVMFTAVPNNAGAAPTYQWQVNGVNAGTNSTTYTNNNFQNNDVVTCSVTNTSTTCTVMPSAISNPYTVEVDPAVTSTIVISPVAEVCTGSSITFTATITNGGSNPGYQWQVNGINKGTNSDTYTDVLNNGDNVTCILTSSESCAAPVTSAAITAVVSSYSTIALAKNVTVTHGNSIQLSPDITGNISSYTWSPATGLDDATISDPVATPDLTTTYTLHVITAAGCDAYGSITVNVYYPIVAPNTFTPNGDSINDVWNVPALANYPNCIVNIYNRYGTPVYSSIGYTTAWDGTYNNKPLPVGTYYYVIDPKDGSPVSAGPLTILR